MYFILYETYLSLIMRSFDCKRLQLECKYVFRLLKSMNKQNAAGLLKGKMIKSSYIITLG